eukprot:c19646_g4_i1.p1 GENE.c19646_g4_i1~~c19646_g4_i1.p1  ORF type:complete len:726 (+),score=132.78 c19646_g4_i1:13-2190(+)
MACPQCNTAFDLEGHCPRILSCGHHFCASCLSGMCSGGTIRCPRDRRQTPVPNGIGDLALNLPALQQQLSGNYPQNDAKLCELCGVHELATHFCDICEQYMCKTAAGAHKRLRVTQDHVLQDIQGTIRTEVRGLVPKAKEVEVVGRQALKQVQDRIATVKRNDQETRAYIEQYFGELREMLRARQDSLTQEVQSLSNQQLSQLEDAQKLIEGLMECVELGVSSASALNPDSDLAVILQARTTALSAIKLGPVISQLDTVEHNVIRVEIPKNSIKKIDQLIPRTAQRTPRDHPHWAEALDASALPYRMPTENNQLRRVLSPANIRAQIKSLAMNTYPIVHAGVEQLLREFLDHKCQFGTLVEQAVYRGMDSRALVSRLLLQRPLTFMLEEDSYVLRTGEIGSGGFEAVGTEGQQAALTLDKVLSYDEMAVAALLSVSCLTPFINNGTRDNKAKKQKRGEFQPYGVLVAQVGARFEKPGFMEYQHIVVSPKQNTEANGYGEKNSKAYCQRTNTQPPGAPALVDKLRFWARFYGVQYFPTVEEVEKLNDPAAYIPLKQSRHYFNVAAYKTRTRLIVEPLLVEAQLRGMHFGRMVYLHVAGVGLGQWRICDQQPQLFVDVVLESLKRNQFPNIACVNFSFIPNVTVPKLVGTIRVISSERNTADTVPDDNFLVATYMWNSNSYPGNDYWGGNLASTGYAAVACCSCIPELQNPELNPYVSGDHARFYLP